MNHLEFAKSESDALIPSDWEKWCSHLETIMGHSIDGDSEEDGYSMGEAYEMWEAGTVFTPCPTPSARVGSITRLPTD